jgi:hypothetical protein
LEVLSQAGRWRLLDSAGSEYLNRLLSLVLDNPDHYPHRRGTEYPQPTPELGPRQP